MKNKTPEKSFIAGCLLTAFLLWTTAVCFIDIQAIGPNGSTVGFGTFNRYVHNLTGVHMSLYTVTDWLSLIPVCFIAGFALLGLAQLIQRKSFRKVDRSILVLGGFYLVVMTAYVFFEVVVVNYRPILIEGYLEASYPSSTTLLTLCVMPTAVMQLNCHIQNLVLRRCLCITINVFTGFMVIARFCSGVHWATDVIGGILLSGSLVMMYDVFSQSKKTGL